MKRGRSALCTDVDGGSRDLSNGRHTERNSALTFTGQAASTDKNLCTLSLCIIAHSRVRVHMCAELCIHVLLSCPCVVLCVTETVSVNEYKSMLLTASVCASPSVSEVKIEGFPFITHILRPSLSFLLCLSPSALSQQPHLSRLSAGTPLDPALCYLILEK